jgi:hypothetical protein
MSPSVERHRGRRGLQVPQHEATRAVEFPNLLQPASTTLRAPVREAFNAWACALRCMSVLAVLGCATRGTAVLRPSRWRR